MIPTVIDSPILMAWVVGQQSLRIPEYTGGRWAIGVSRERAESDSPSGPYRQLPMCPLSADCSRRGGRFQAQVLGQPRIFSPMGRQHPDQAMTSAGKKAARRRERTARRRCGLIGCVVVGVRVLSCFRWAATIACVSGRRSRRVRVAEVQASRLIAHFPPIAFCPVSRLHQLRAQQAQRETREQCQRGGGRK
jgi:hypothetical protein